MIQTETPVGRFFHLYATETANDNIPAIVAHFSDPFLAAGPSGAQSVRVADFAAALPKKKALFSRLESQPSQLIALHETPLDSRYVLVSTTWRMTFLGDRPSAQQLDVDSTFLVDTVEPQTDPADFKILLYLTHQDLMQIARDRGLLPA